MGFCRQATRRLSAMVAVLAGFTGELSGSLQEWVMSVVNARMELAGIAVSFINDLDVKQKEVIEKVHVEMLRMNERVSEMTIMKEGIKKTYTDPQHLKAGTTSFAESTSANLTAGAAGNEQAIQKANNVHEQVNDVFAKASVSFEENERKVTELALGFGTRVRSLRDGVRTWSQIFASQVEQMVQTGKFKFDHTPVVAAPKRDIKEVSVWKLPDGVSKPDFRHWLNSVDI